MTLQVEIQDLRRMLKEKCEEIISDKKLAYEFYLRICEIEEDDRFTMVEELLEEQEAMIKPTKCHCGELFDAKDSSFCPKCGCAYGELSGRYTNIGR